MRPYVCRRPMKRLVRCIWSTVAITLCSGLSQAAPVNTTGTGCECYYDKDCPDEEGGMGFCWLGVGCDIQGDPEDINSKPLDGLCGFIPRPGDPGSAGSSCGSVSPTAVAKVVRTWASAFDKAGAKGGGPVGTFTARAYKLSHQLIPSPRCRLEIARKALDLQ